MDSFQQFGGSRHEYRLKGWQRGFYLVLGLAMGAFAIFMLTNASAQQAQDFVLLPALFFLAIGIYLAALALRSKLVIEGNRIEVQYAFRERSADLREIEGFRTVTTRNGSFLQLQLNEGKGRITISRSFQSDDDQRAWFQQLTDLDERGRKALLDEIEKQESLGATPEQRLAAVKRARLWNLCVTSVAVAAAVGFNLAEGNLRIFSAAILALVPVVVQFLVHREPLLYAIFKPRRDPRADLGIAFMASGVGLLLGARNVEFISMKPLLPYILLGSLVCAMVVYGANRSSAQVWGVMIAALFFAIMYGYGLAVAVDTLADQSKAASFVATITGKHTTSGSRTTTYYLNLEPWGPIQKPNVLTVSRDFYQAAAPGDGVCLDLHAGALRVPWYKLVNCHGQPAAQPPQ